ncbi:hypothetical protein Gogos_007066, partial [Gossypium gossypioides]|nr:hypothetical protein [Gossypium gossypioides]
EQSLRLRANSLESSIRRLRSLITSLLSQKLLDPKLADKLEEDLERARCFVTDGDAAAFLPAKYQGIDCLSVSSLPINFAYFKILDLGRMLACIPSSAVPGRVRRPKIVTGEFEGERSPVWGGIFLFVCVRT